MGNWNGAYTGSGRQWAVMGTDKSAQYLWDGIREREKAANKSGTLTTISALPVSGDTAIKASPLVSDNSGGSPTSYEQARATVYELARYFVRKVMLDGTTPYWPEGTNHIDSCRREGSGGSGYTTPTFTDIVFPAGQSPPAGALYSFSRRFPLEIFTLSDSNAIGGTRARFVRYAFSGQRTFGRKTGTPNFGSAVTTPTLEWPNDGKLFDLVGGTWVLSVDQLTPPTVVEEKGVPRRYPGDYHDGKGMEEIRDGTNQLTRTAGYAQDNPGIGGSQVPGWTGTAGPSFNGGTADAAHSNSGSNSPLFTDHTSRAHCDASYITGGTAISAGANKVTVDSNFDTVEDGWHVDSAQVTFVVPGDQYINNTSMPNPLGQTRTVHFFVLCQPFSSAGAQWDTQGRSDVLQSVWHEIPTAMSNSGTSIVGPVFGNVTLPPNWPTGAPPGQRGWTQWVSYYLLDWSAPGGFVTSDTTP